MKPKPTQSMALILFTSMKAERMEEAVEETFKASRAWFMSYKERSCLFNGEEQSVVARYPENPAEIIFEGGHTEEQIFNIHETALYWQKMPTRILIAGEEKLVLDFKASKDRLTCVRG